MTERPVSQVFQDILETINYLEGFTNGVSFEAFEANPEKLFAVVKAIEVSRKTREFIRIEGLQLEDWEFIR
jgi:uncharacterized protein with HEPN domain